MNELKNFSISIQELLPEEKQFLHKIYAEVVEDYSYLWVEVENLDRLRQILILIIKLFIEEHKGLQDLSQRIIQLKFLFAAFQRNFPTQIRNKYEELIGILQKLENQ